MKPNACFIVRDRNRQALTYVYYQEEPGRAAMLSAHAEIKRIVQILLIVGTGVEIHGQQVLRSLQ